MKRMKAVRYQAANHCNALTETSMSSTVTVLQYKKMHISSRITLDIYDYFSISFHIYTILIKLINLLYLTLSF